MDIFDLAEKGKIKRIFKARNKISFPGAVCHITQRAGGREPLFLESNDYLYMLHILKRSAREFNFDLFAYCLMPNHLHLLIRLGKDNLSKAMKFIFGSYAVYFNKKYEKKGHVFGGAYRQALCLADDYFLIASLYIHLNPMRSGLISNPIRYRWSSCKLYTNSLDKKTFVNVDFILKILDNDKGIAKKYYEELLSKAVHIKTQETWENPKALESFKSKFLKNLLKSKKDLSKELKDFLDEHNIEEKIEALKTQGRLRAPETLKARKFLIEQLRARGYSQNDIAAMLKISRQTVYRALMLHF